LQTNNTEPTKSQPQPKSEDEDYLLALKLMQEEEALVEREKKARLLAEDEALAKLLMEQEHKPVPKSTPITISDADYAAQLYARDRDNNSTLASDAQIAKLLQEKQELEERLRQAENMPKETVLDVSSVEYPSEWQPQSSPFQSFDVVRGTEEWRIVEERFTQGLPHCPISRIERVQNKQLWLWFYFKKKELDSKNSSSHGANEKFAFHGSRANAYDIILKDGFDHRVANMGGAYGAGIYFAHNSATSSSYVANSGFSGRKMLYCRVIAGDIGPGKSGLRRPPEKKTWFGKSELYDSVGNDGGVYVIFDNHQAYPQYVIHF